MHVLIVDDSRFTRQFLKQQMLQYGADCVEAGDGAQGLAELQVPGKSFDLMLVDINMPILNGLDCVRLLREQGLQQTMKILMVTTEAETNLIEQALASGVDEFLMKPFMEQSLREKLLLLGLSPERS